jgi:hypothetical protein
MLELRIHSPLDNDDGRIAVSTTRLQRHDVFEEMRLVAHITPHSMGHIGTIVFKDS